MKQLGVKYKGPPGVRPNTMAKLNWKRNAMKNSRHLNESDSIDASDVSRYQFRPLYRLVSLLQLCCVSFFALNQDLLLKFGHSVCWVVALLVSAAVHAPCLFNCYVYEGTFSSSISPDTLVTLSHLMTLLHAFFAGCTVFMVGGEMRRFILCFTELCEKVRNGRRKLTLIAYLLFLIVLAACAMQSYILIRYSSQRVYRSYIPDQEKVSDAAEGKAPYVWPFEALLTVKQQTFMIASIFCRAILLIHIRSLEVTLVHLSLSINMTRMHRLKSMMKLPVKGAVNHLSKVIHSIVFTSFLFNSFTIMISGTIVAGVSMRIYFIPETYYYDLFQLCQAVFFTVFTLFAGFLVKVRMMNFTRKPVNISMTTGLQKLILLVLLTPSAIVLYVMYTKCQDTVVKIEYFFDATFDWFSTMSIPSESLEKFMEEFNETSASGKYLSPSYFQMKSDEMWDEKERDALVNFLNNIL